MSYFDPHRVNRKNNLYYQHKGQTISSRLVTPSPYVDRNLVPTYLDYILDNHLVPAPPALPYSLNFLRAKIQPQSGGDFYPINFQPIRIISYDDITVTLNTTSLHGWYLFRIYLKSTPPYTIYYYMFALIFVQQNKPPLTLNYTHDPAQQFIFEALEAYVTEPFDVTLQQTRPPYFIWAQFEVSPVNGLQTFFVPMLQIDDYDAYVSQPVGVSPIEELQNEEPK